MDSYIKTGLTNPYDMVVDDEFIYVGNAYNTIKCLIKEGGTRWTINSSASILDTKGDTIFITEYGCIGLLDRYSGELIDMWTYDIDEIYYGFYDEYYKAFIVLTSDKELLKINNSGEIFERDPLNTDIYLQYCSGIYSQNNGTFGMLYRNVDSEENILIDYSINRYGEIIQTNEIDGYPHGNNLNGYPGIGIRSAVNRNGILYFINDENRTVGAIENNKIIWHKNTLNIWYSDKCTTWLQTSNGNIYLAGEDGELLEYTNYTLSKTSGYIKNNWESNWGVELGEQIGVKDGNKIYLFDENLNKYDSIMVERNVDLICNSMDLSKFIFSTRLSPTIYNILIYNNNYEPMDSFQLNVTPHGWGWWFSGFISGMDIDAMDRMYFQDYWGEKAMIYDLSGNKINTINGDFYEGALFGGNNRVREFIVDDRDGISIRDITGNTLAELHTSYSYVPLMEEDKGIIIAENGKQMKRYNAYHKKSGTWIYLLDTENDDTYFENVTVDKYIPDGTSIEIKFRSSNDSSNIDNAIWSKWYNENEISLNGIQGRFLEIQAQLSTMDSTISPYLQGLGINTNLGTTYFAADTIISDISAGMQYSLDWNTLIPEQADEYYMKGKIRNKYEQLLYVEKDKFDVIDSDYAILLQTEKDDYKPYEDIALDIIIYNLTSTDDNFAFKLYKDNSLYLDTTIFISDSVIINKSFSDERSFNINTFLLLGDTICSKSKKIFIYAPDIMVELQCDDETYSEEMNANMLVKNIGVHPVLLNINFGDIFVTDSLYPDKQKSINNEFYVYSDTIINGFISGDIDLETQKQIKYQRKADINIQCNSKYTPQTIDFPYSFITNTEGKINLELRVLKDNNEIESINGLFYLNPDETRKLENTYIDSFGLGQNSFWGIDIDNDTTYITDIVNSELCIYDINMNLITKIPNIIGAAGIDIEDDKIYVTEAEDGSFKIYNKLYELENTVYGLGYPIDIEVIGDDIYIVDMDNTGIMHYNTNGDYLGCLGRESLDKPAGIEEYNGKIYVSDNLKNKIFIFDYTFGIIDSVTDNLYDIEGLAFDDFGYLYVGNSDNNTISVFSINGEFVYRTEPLKAVWADAYTIYNNKYYTLNNGDVFIYDFEGNEQLNYLSMDLQKGHYLITADISDERGLGKLSHREYEFDVYDGDTVNIDKFVVEADTIRTDGTFPVEFEVSNIGAETFSGSYRLSLGNVCIISDTLIIDVGMTRAVVHNIDIPFEVGEYDAELIIIKDKQNIAYNVLPFTAKTDFIFDYVYDNVTIMSGEFGKIPYGIRNRGIAYGSDYIKYDLGEFLRDSFNILLDRNDIYNDTLYLDIADDIPSGQYNGYIFTKNYRELLLFNVEGLDVSITHTLDKDAYRDGENAVFTMYYENNNNFCPSLYSYLRYNDFTDEGFNRVGGYADDLININNIGISGTGEYISGLFTIDDLGQRDSILFNIYSPLLLGNGINGFVRYSNSGLHFTDWDSLIGPGFLNIPNGQYYMQYKLALNQNTTIDSVVIGNKVLKGKDDFQMNEDSIKFTVPIAQAGNSLFYSVYTNYGRSILISNEYINRINDTIQVQLDKYLYNAGDTILVNIESEYTGKLEWNISGGMDSDPYGNWEITDTNTIKTIDIPLKSVSGFYTYNYTFLGFDTVINDSIIVTNSIPFNVKGYELSVKNIYIDKEQYYPGERVYADFDIIANRDMLVNIICYFKDENNNYSICYNDNRWINTGSEIIGIQTGDIPDIYGNCELIYKFYLIGLNKNMLMADGQKAFFVEDLTNPQFLMIDVAPCTLRTDVDDSVFAYFELSENCKVGYFTFNDITKVRTNILNGSVAWNIFEDGAQLHTGEYSVFAKAFDYAGNATIPVSRSVYVICEESDTIPPSTEFIVGEPKYLNDSIMYINGASTELNIISNDDDVMTIYYKINNGNWEEYNSGIILEQDGINVIQHYAEDITGNTGNIIYDSVYNDIYLPMASINVNEPYYNGYVSASTMIDVHLDDIGSGIETGTLTINDDSVHLTDTSYMFNLQAPSGEKDLSVSVYDNVGNANEINQMLFLDTDMPSCSMYITGSQYMQYLGNDASINITSSDAISGLKGSFLIINYDTIYGFDEIHFPVSGIELINCEYYSIDNVLNMSEIGMDAFIGDYTPPVTELAISNDYYYSDREYVSSRSVLTLSAEDDASGVDTTIMTINGECADINNSVLTVYGLNSVEYYSIDNVENTEDINARAIYMDNVVPDYSLSFDGEYIDSVPYIVNMNTQITINGTDDLSGVRYIHYSIDNTNNTIIGNSLNIPEEGLHTLYIKLSDNVNNITGWQSEAVYVDNTPPEVSVEIGLPKYNDYITSESPIKLIASDEIAGVRRVTYYINGDEYTYNEPFTITGPDGEYTIGYRAVDKVGNESELQSITVNLDNTSPEITINYNEPQYYGDYQFVSSQSLIDIEAYDTGSGQKRITYDINEILSGEGASALTISLINLDENVYNLLVKAWDNLDNEAEKQDEFVIDDSHPLTNLAIGDPQYIKSDTMLMTSNTPLELTAADKPDNTPASGVYEMIYGHISPLNHVNNSNYTDYVNDEDGVYQYRYYSVDNLDNTEPVNERTIELDNTAPEVIITYPYDGIFINQDVTIKGYADDKNFRRWKLEYKIEEALSWNTITDWQTTVPSDSSLGQFNASELQSGVYTVKLTAEDLVENMNTYEITIKVGEPQQDLELTGYLKPEGVWGGDYIYIADTQHKRVVKTNEDNSLLLEIREFQPRDVFIDSRGRIFTTDLDNKVYVYSSQGDEIKTIDGHLHPKGVEVRFNKIYAADTYKNRIVVYNMNGEIDMTIPVNKHPEGIAVDEDGNIFTCIDESNEIRGYSSTGEEIFRYGVVGHGLGEFVRAVDIDVDSKGYLWVCDRNNNRIHMIDWRNELDLFILGERGQEERHKDGMNKPAGLSVVEEDGEIKYIYIADTNNDRIIRYNMSIVATDRKAGIASAQANGLEIEQFLPYPNPTSDESTIRVVLSQPAELEINIFTLTGKLVYNYSETGNAGINEVIWTGINADGTDVLNGVYNIQVRATSGNSTVERWSKIALIR